MKGSVVGALATMTDHPSFLVRVPTCGTALVTDLHDDSRNGDATGLFLAAAAVRARDAGTAAIECAAKALDTTSTTADNATCVFLFIAPGANHFGSWTGPAPRQ